MDEIPINLANEEVLELATAFVEKYASFLEELPFDLQRKVTRLREIDCDYREILSEIEELHESFIKEKDLNVARKSTHCLCKIQYLLGRCQVLGDEKISIVQQVSETIENKKKAVEHSGYRFQSLYRTDQKNECNGKREMARMDYSKAAKRPRRREKTDKDKESLLDGGNDDDDALLDFALSNSNAIVYSEKQKSNASHETSGTGGVSNKSTESSHSKHELLSSRKSDKLIKKEPSPASSSSSSSVISSTVSSQKSSSNKTTSFKSAMPSSKATISTIFNGSNKSLAKKKKKIKKKQIEKPVRSPSPGPELPIDPDEPTYCLCDQVSYGQMIGCDNKKCPIEWFHFSCVGLSHKPKGKWYCPDCTKGMKDRKRDSKKDYHR